MQKYTIFIGIDISKQWFDACLYWPEQNRKPLHQRFENVEKGFERFSKWLTKQTNVSKKQYYVCLEHTGVYSLRLAHFLREQKIAFVLESALRIKRSVGLQRTKTDKADALAIAQYAARFHKQHKTRSLPLAELLKLQALLSLRSRLVRYRHGLRLAANELDSSSYQAISAVVQSFNDPLCTQMEVQIRQVDQTIAKLMLTDEQLSQLDRLVQSVKGVGPVISAYLLVYTNAFTAFDKAREFACYIGIAPFKYKSGTSIELPDQVSPLANRRLKALLSSAAIVAIRHDPQIRAYYEKQLARGKQPGWIYNAVKNKIVHRIFAVVKRGTPYVVLDQYAA